MSIRDLRKKARRQLHDAMSLPAIYAPKGYGDEDGIDTLETTVRVHDQVKQFGDLTGFDYAPVERIVPVPEIVVLADEVSPVRGGVFTLASDEAYTVELVMPRNGITVTCQVTRLDAADIASAGYPYPGQVAEEIDGDDG